MNSSNNRETTECSLPEKNYPNVSIIIVNYNGYRWLRLCIPSLSNTNYPVFEIIVVDNASADQSINYLRSTWAEFVRVIEVKENVGFAEACNIGFRESKGEVIALLNNDMEVDKNWLINAVEMLKSNENVGSVQSKIMQHNDREKIWCAGLSIDSFGLGIQIGHGEIDHGQYDHLSEIWASDGGAMFVWKRILLKTGLFDGTSFLYYEAVDLSWRIRLSGYKNLLAPSSLVYHVGSATTKTVPSSFIIFHSTKNHIASWLKNYSLKTLLFKLPMLITLVVGSLMLEILHGRFGLFKARVKSIKWIFENINHILKERHKVQHVIRSRGISDKILFNQGKKKNASNVSRVLKKSFV